MVKGKKKVEDEMLKKDIMDEYWRYEVSVIKNNIDSFDVIVENSFGTVSVELDREEFVQFVDECKEKLGCDE